MNYFWATCVLAPFFRPPTSSDTTLVFTALHPKSNGYFHFSSKTVNQTKTLNFFLIPQVNIPMHAAFIGKWSFWDGFWTPLELFSPRRFIKWILSIVPILFSYHIRSHSTPNCMCPWKGLPFNHGQAFKWSSFHCSGGNIVSIHKLCFMPLISRNLCNNFLPTSIWSCN